MSHLATRVLDKRLLRRIRKVLTSGIMIGGLVEPAYEGTSQVGALSPLLSNFVLDELDKEFEDRKLRAVHYADDFLIFFPQQEASNPGDAKRHRLCHQEAEIEGERRENLDNSSLVDVLSRIRFHQQTR